MKIEDLQIDPELRDLLPPLSKDEYKELEESILKHGMQDAIKIWTDEATDKTYIVDGHNRYSICKKHNIDFAHWQICELSSSTYPTKKDIIKFMLDTQLGRRNLTPAQKYAIASKYKSLFEKQAKKNMSDGGKGLTNLSKVNTRKQMAKAVGVSEGSIAKLDKIYESDNDEVKKKVLAGEESIDKGFKQVVNKTAKPNSENRAAQFSDTDDCDAAITELEQKEKQLREEKQKIYILRQDLYDATPNDDLHCEVEELNESSILDHKFVFYFVKAKNKKLIFEVNSCPIEKTENMLQWIDLYRIRGKEKDILLSKYFQVQKSFLEKQKIKEQSQYQQATNQQILSNQFLSVLKAVKGNPLVKEIIGTGYKALAKKYHPDVTKDDGKQMQTINEAKDALDKLIS